MKRQVGRPMRYKHILEALEEDSLYSPSMIAEYAEKKGLLRIDPNDPEARVNAKLRIRITMGRLSNNHQFPKEGDGPVMLPGQRPLPAWYGWRWKITLHESVPAPPGRGTKPSVRKKEVKNRWEIGIERHHQIFSGRENAAKPSQASPTKAEPANGGTLSKKPGRPPKYGELLLALEDEALYTAATICAYAEERGLLESDPRDADARALERKRIRTALIRKKAMNHFPALGDGQVMPKGRAYMAAWFGWRWKSTVPRARVSEKSRDHDPAKKPS